MKHINKLSNNEYEKNMMVPYQKGSFCEISLGHILIISPIILGLIFLSLYKTIAMIGSTTLGKSFVSFLYTQILILSFCFAISTTALTKPLVLFSFRFFLCVLLLNPLFSQPNGNETHRYPVVLFSPLVLSLCFSLFCCRFRFRFSFMLTVVLPLFF